MNAVSLYDFLTTIKGLLEGSLPSGAWIVAEISDAKVNSSGHCYMELIEKGEGQQPRAQCRGVVWRNDYIGISSRFMGATGRAIAPGMKILCRVGVSFHQQYGFSLRIVDVDPAYTMGEIERQKQLTIEQLKREGIFDLNHSTPMTEVVQRIAVVCSSTAAGYGDFMRELGQYHYRLNVELFEALVQGAAAEVSIINALSRIAERSDDFDAIVVIRGGGSQSDLSCFDAYNLCYHLTQMPLPVITGIGHDKDQSIADMVASVHLKTPTAVAVWIVERAAAMERRIDMVHLRVQNETQQLLDSQQNRTNNNAHQLHSMALELTRRLEVRLENFSTTMQERARNLLNKQSERLSMYENIVQGRNPQRILAMGFAVVRNSQGAITDPSRLSSGQKVEITFAQGVKNATID